MDLFEEPMVGMTAIYRTMERVNPILSEAVVSEQKLAEESIVICDSEILRNPNSTSGNQRLNCEVVEAEE